MVYLLRIVMLVCNIKTQQNLNFDPINGAVIFLIIRCMGLKEELACCTQCLMSVIRHSERGWLFDIFPTVFQESLSILVLLELRCRFVCACQVYK